MGNALFQKARETVAIAKQAVLTGTNPNPHEAITIAKNALSSAYANSTIAEKEQLRELQEELDSLK